MSSESANTSGIASVNTVATAAMAANTIVSVLVLIDSIRKSSIGSLHPQRRTHQKSKLIIFFITITPIDIQTAEAASITRPSGSVHNSEM